MSKLTANRPKIGPSDTTTLRSFVPSGKGLIPLAPDVKTSTPIVPPARGTVANTSTASNNTSTTAITIPTMMSLDWNKINLILRNQLTSLASNPSTPSVGYQYLRADASTGKDTIFSFSCSDTEQNAYVSGYNAGDDKYRLRGNYKLGFRYIKQGNNCDVSSYFIELTPKTVNGEDYITSSVVQEATFSYSSEAEVKEVNTDTLDVFRLVLNFPAANHSVRSVNWKCLAMGGNAVTPCVDIPSGDGKVAVGATLYSVPISKSNVSFETYIALEAKDEILNLYTQEIQSATGGVFAMLSGKNKSSPATQSPVTAFSFRTPTKFAINTSSKSPSTLALAPASVGTTGGQLTLNFVSNQSGKYSGFNFKLPFNISDTDPSTYTMDDTSALIWSIFLFLKPTSIDGEKTYPLGSDIKWTTEKVSDASTFSNTNTITWNNSKAFKPVSGSMDKFFLKGNAVDLIQPKNMHVIKISMILALPDA